MATRRSTRSTQQVNYADDKVQRENQQDFVHSTHTDYLSYFEGPAQRFLQSIMDKWFDCVDGGILSSSIHHLKPKAEEWGIVDKMEKYFANFLGTSAFLYFKKEAFEHCCKTLKKKNWKGHWTLLLQ